MVSEPLEESSEPEEICIDFVLEDVINSSSVMPPNDFVFHIDFFHELLRLR